MSRARSHGPTRCARGWLRRAPGEALARGLGRGLGRGLRFRGEGARLRGACRVERAHPGAARTGRMPMPCWRRSRVTRSRTTTASCWFARQRASRHCGQPSAVGVRGDRTRRNTAASTCGQGTFAACASRSSARVDPKLSARRKPQGDHGVPLLLLVEMVHVEPTCMLRRIGDLRTVLSDESD